MHRTLRIHHVEFKGGDSDADKVTSSRNQTLQVLFTLIDGTSTLRHVQIEELPKSITVPEDVEKGEFIFQDISAPLTLNEMDGDKEVALNVSSTEVLVVRYSVVLEETPSSESNQSDKEETEELEQHYSAEFENEDTLRSHVADTAAVTLDPKKPQLEQHYSAEFENEDTLRSHANDVAAVDPKQPHEEQKVESNPITPYPSSRVETLQLHSNHTSPPPKQQLPVRPPNISYYETPLLGQKLGVRGKGTLKVIVKDAYLLSVPPGTRVRCCITLHTIPVQIPNAFKNFRRLHEDVTKQTALKSVSDTSHVVWEETLEFEQRLMRENAKLTLVVYTELNRAVLKIKKFLFKGMEDVSVTIPSETAYDRITLSTTPDPQAVQLSSLILRFDDVMAKMGGHEKSPHVFRIRVTHADVLRRIDLPHARGVDVTQSTSKHRKKVEEAVKGVSSIDPRYPNTATTWGEALEIENRDEPVFVSVVLCKPNGKQYSVGDAWISIEDVVKQNEDVFAKLTLNRPGESWAHILMRDYEIQSLRSNGQRGQLIQCLDRLLFCINDSKTRGEKEVRAAGKMADAAREAAMEVRQRLRAWHTSVVQRINYLTSLMTHLKNIGHMENRRLADIHARLFDALSGMQEPQGIDEVMELARDSVLQCLAGLGPLHLSSKPNKSQQQAIDAVTAGCRYVLRRHPFVKGEISEWSPASVFEGLFNTLRPLYENSHQAVNSTPSTAEGTMIDQLSPMFCSLEDYFSSQDHPVSLKIDMVPVVASGDPLHITMFVLRHLNYVADYESDVAIVELVSIDESDGYQQETVRLRTVVDVLFGAGCLVWHFTEIGKFEVRFQYKYLQAVVPIEFIPGPLSCAMIDIKPYVVSGEKVPLKIRFVDKNENTCTSQNLEVRVFCSDRSVDVAGSVVNGIFETEVVIPASVTNNGILLSCEVIIPQGMTIQTKCNVIQVFPVATALVVEVISLETGNPVTYVNANEEYTVRVTPVDNSGQQAVLHTTAAGLEGPKITLRTFPVTLWESRTTTPSTLDHNAYFHYLFHAKEGSYTLQAYAGSLNPFSEEQSSNKEDEMEQSKVELIKGTTILQVQSTKARCLRFAKFPKVVGNEILDDFAVHAVDVNNAIDNNYCGMVTIEPANESFVIVGASPDKPLEVTLTCGVAKIPKFQVSSSSASQSAVYSFRVRSVGLLSAESPHLPMDTSMSTIPELGWDRDARCTWVGKEPVLKFEGNLSIPGSRRTRSNNVVKVYVVLPGDELLLVATENINKPADSSTLISFEVPQDVVARMVCIMATRNFHHNAVMCTMAPILLFGPSVQLFCKFPTTSVVDEEMELRLEVRNPFVATMTPIKTRVVIGSSKQWDGVVRTVELLNNTPVYHRFLQPVSGNHVLVATIPGVNQPPFALGNLSRTVRCATKFDFTCTAVIVEGSHIHVMLTLYDEDRNVVSVHDGVTVELQLLSHDGTVANHIVTKIEKSGFTRSMSTQTFGLYKLRLVSAFLVYTSPREIFVRPYRGISCAETKYITMAFRSIYCMNLVNLSLRCFDECFPEVPTGATKNPLTLFHPQPEWVKIQTLVENVKRIVLSTGSGYGSSLPTIPPTSSQDTSMLSAASCHHKHCGNAFLQLSKTSNSGSAANFETFDPPTACPNSVQVLMQWRWKIPPQAHTQGTAPSEPPQQAPQGPLPPHPSTMLSNTVVSVNKNVPSTTPTPQNTAHVGEKKTIRASEATSEFLPKPYRNIGIMINKLDKLPMSKENGYVMLKVFLGGQERHSSIEIKPIADRTITFKKNIFQFRYHEQTNFKVQVWERPPAVRMTSDIAKPSDFTIFIGEFVASIRESLASSMQQVCTTDLQPRPFATRYSPIDLMSSTQTLGTVEYKVREGPQRPDKESPVELQLPSPQSPLRIRAPLDIHSPSRKRDVHDPHSPTLAKDTLSPSRMKADDVRSLQSPSQKIHGMCPFHFYHRRRDGHDMCPLSPNARAIDSHNVFHFKGTRPEEIDLQISPTKHEDDTTQHEDPIQAIVAEPSLDESEGITIEVHQEMLNLFSEFTLYKIGEGITIPRSLRTAEKGFLTRLCAVRRIECVLRALPLVHFTVQKVNMPNGVPSGEFKFAIRIQQDKESHHVLFTSPIQYHTGGGMSPASSITWSHSDGTCSLKIPANLKKDDRSPILSVGILLNDKEVCSAHIELGKLIFASKNEISLPCFGPSNNNLSTLNTIDIRWDVAAYELVTRSQQASTHSLEMSDGSSSGVGSVMRGCMSCGCISLANPPECKECNGADFAQIYVAEKGLDGRLRSVL